MESRFFLDVVVGKSSSVLKLLSSEDETLLVRWDTFLILDLSLDAFNSVSSFDVQGDSLSRQGLDEDLHTSSESEN